MLKLTNVSVKQVTLDVFYTMSLFSVHSNVIVVCFSEQ